MENTYKDLDIRKERYRKSAITLLQTKAQSVFSDETTVAFDCIEYRSGCSIRKDENSILFEHEGLYQMVGNVVFIASDPGQVHVSLFLGDRLIGSSFRSTTVGAGEVCSICSQVPVLEIDSEDISKPVTMEIAFVRGIIEHATLSAIKLA